MAINFTRRPVNPTKQRTRRLVQLPRNRTASHKTPNSTQHRNFGHQVQSQSPSPFNQSHHISNHWRVTLMVTSQPSGVLTPSWRRSRIVRAWSVMRSTATVLVRRGFGLSNGDGPEGPTGLTKGQDCTTNIRAYQLREFTVEEEVDHFRKGV